MTKVSESVRLVMQEVSGLWRIPTSTDKYISGNFSPEELSSAHRLLKSEKAIGPDSICSEPILRAGADLKSWLNKLLSFCMRQLKLRKLKLLEKSIIGCCPEAK